MICFHFSSGSSGKIEIRSWDLLDDPILLEELVNDILTSVLEVLPELVSLEELPLAIKVLRRRFKEIWVEGIDAVKMLTSAGLSVVTKFLKSVTKGNSN